MRRALDLVRASGLSPLQKPRFHGVRERWPFLEIGLEVSPDVVATVGVRRLASQAGHDDERLVRQVVEDLGYSYVPRASGLHVRVG